MQAAPRLPIVRASLALALFATGRTEEAQAVYETLRRLPAAGDTDMQTLYVLLHLMALIIACGDREMAQAVYGLFRLQAADTGACQVRTRSVQVAPATAQAWPVPLSSGRTRGEHRGHAGRRNASSYALGAMGYVAGGGGGVGPGASTVPGSG
jgi:hypothetical protein